MRVLGIDPGVATTGWAVLQVESNGTSYSVLDYGVISTEKGFPLSDRLSEIYTDIDVIIKKFSPDYASVESILFCTNAKTAISVGESRGVVLLCIEKNGLPLYEFTPLQVKNFVAGYGKAEKSQVQEAVKLLCNLNEIAKPDDAADAIAVAICCAGEIGARQLTIDN